MEYKKQNQFKDKVTRPWQDTQIFIRTYAYQEKENKLVPVHELYLPICRGSELTVGKIYWKAEKFAAVPDAVPMELNGFILSRDTQTKQDGEQNFHDTSQKTEFSVKISPPGKEYQDFWHLGVLLEVEGNLRLAIGNERMYMLSDKIYLAPNL